MSSVDYSEAMQLAIELEDILNVLCDLCAAYGRKEIDRNTMGSLVAVAHDKTDSFYRSVRRKKGTERMKEIAAERHALWQEEANEVSREDPRLKKNAVAEQVRINLGYKGPADTIARVIKIPKK